MQEQTHEQLVEDRSIKALVERWQNHLTHKNEYWGIHCTKHPIDWWAYQEIIYETKPTVIIEVGNQYGGTLLWLAHQMDLMGNGMVIGVDVNHEVMDRKAKEHPRVRLFQGDAEEKFEAVRELVYSGDRVMVIEDSSHAMGQCLSVLRTYGSLVTAGCYLICEDSICYHGLETGPKPGPWEAIDKFMEGNTEFEMDRSREAFGLTWNPRGYLRKR
jgi:cephalosporin hydroxylase